MADIVDGIAQHLAAAGLVDYAPTGTAGDLFVGTMPTTPDLAVSLTPYDAGEQDSAIDYDVLRLQLRVRGDEDPRTSYDRAYGLYGELHGLSGITLPNGVELILCVAQGTPGPLGPDADGRHEHVLNVRCEYVAPTAHRA